jgi:hypothetical protein
MLQHTTNGCEHTRLTSAKPRIHTGLTAQLRGALALLTDLATHTESTAQHDALTLRIQRIKNLLNGGKV